MPTHRKYRQIRQYPSTSFRAGMIEVISKIADYAEFRARMIDSAVRTLEAEAEE
jgi:hypothetical protein